VNPFALQVGQKCHVTRYGLRPITVDHLAATRGEGMPPRLPEGARRADGSRDYDVQVRRASLLLSLASVLGLAGCSGVRHMNWDPSGDPSGEYRVSRFDIEEGAREFLGRLAHLDSGRASEAVAEFRRRYEDVEVAFLQDGTIVGTADLPWADSRFGRWIRGAGRDILILDARNRFLAVSIEKRGLALRIGEGDPCGPFPMIRYALVRVF
jgi:hypothetical protein